MSQCLRREPADHFRTCRVSLGVDSDICPYGGLLTFAEVQALRKVGVIQEQGGKRIFANLGVSLQLTVRHGSRRALVLVEQNGFLKLVSGYVPAEHLDNPLITAWAELMEEVLPFSDGQCYGYSSEGQPLADPYELNRQSFLPVTQSSFLFEDSGENFSFKGKSLSWPVTGYIHSSTASFQLVFPVEVVLPQKVTLLHVEDSFDGVVGELLSILDENSYVVLMALDKNNLPTGELFTLGDGHWKPFSKDKLQLSEFFRGLGQRLARPF
ncbi:hypothetical protein [Parendozoicomonas sp. Alg238-R29]|uniref:hypothetical protein n=1 Tax=Parendozoicomonas sp. Alg238-R29 TaxID=2993446 RepID=UPI00248F3CCD|nr:hypothetical protein [Parendozoicomonas sp. Alg238-R29]